MKFHSRISNLQYQRNMREYIHITPQVEEEAFYAKAASRGGMVLDFLAMHIISQRGCT